MRILTTSWIPRYRSCRVTIMESKKSEHFLALGLMHRMKCGLPSSSQQETMNENAVTHLQALSVVMSCCSCVRNCCPNVDFEAFFPFLPATAGVFLSCPCTHAHSAQCVARKNTDYLLRCEQAAHEGIPAGCDNGCEGVLYTALSVQADGGSTTRRPSESLFFSRNNWML